MTGDDRKILEDSIEALVLGFHLDESTAQFEFIFELWEPQGTVRSFARFQFHGVRRFAQTTPRVAGTRVIQQVRVRASLERKFLSISMGYRSSFEFEFDDVRHDVVRLRAESRGRHRWQYFELGTNRAVDLNNLFDTPEAATTGAALTL